MPRGACDILCPWACAAAFVAGLIPAAALGWWQTLTGSSPATKWLGLAAHLASTPGTAVVATASGRLLRAYGPFSHPNVFGGYLAVGLIICLLLDASLRRRARWLNAAAALFLGGTLVVTFSRAAFIALSLGILTALVLRRLPMRGNRALAALVIGFALAAVWFRVPLSVRADASGRLERQSLSLRVSQLGEWGNVFRASPLLGVGTSAYTAALGRAFPSRAAYDLQPVHDVFLLILAEQGMLGFLALAWLAWTAVRCRAREFLLPAAVLLPLVLFDHYPWSSWSGLALVVVACVLLPALANGARACYHKASA